MIRVLQFADVINRHDFIDVIVQNLDRTRFEVGVCVRSEACNIARPEFPADAPRWVVPWRSRRTLLAAAWRLANVLRRWRVDVLHTHHYDEALIGWMATRLHRRTRLVVGRHYSDAIYRSARGWKRRTLLALERVVNRSATRIVVPSRYIAEILVEWQHVPSDKIDLVPYAFCPEKYVVPTALDVGQIKHELGLNGQLVLGNFSRLHEEKGHRFLIEAMQKLHSRLDVTLLIVGEGPERAALQRQIATAGLERGVRLLGWRRDAMRLMAAVDAVVQPTLQEAFSQVMAEALWMGKPLVISDVSGAPDVVRDGETGLLVPKEDPAALARAIERLASDAILRTRLGEAGRAYVRKHLVVEKIIPQYERAYLKAMR